MTAVKISPCCCSINVSRSLLKRSAAVSCSIICNSSMDVEAGEDGLGAVTSAKTICSLDSEFSSSNSGRLLEVDSESEVVGV